MYHHALLFVLLAASYILCDARHTVIVSQNRPNSYLPSFPKPDVCMTPTCVIAAADVLRSMNEAIDPCDDFYTFACGGWIKRQEVSDAEPEIDLLTITQKELDRELRDLLESKYKSSDPPFVKTMKDFYNICVDVDTLEKQGSEPQKIMLKRFGGWPVVEGSHWDESTFDWIDTLTSFRKLGYEYDSLLNLYLDSDPENDTVIMIYLDIPYMGRLMDANLTLGLNDPKVAAYHRSMMKAAKLLGADETTAKRDLQEALLFGMALVNIRNEVSKEEQNQTKITIKELQKELPQVSWLKLINGLLLIREVYEDEAIVNVKPDFLPKFADLITSTDKRVIANYMLWQVVLQTGEYLSKEWRDIVEDEEEDKKSIEEPRWKTCLSNVKDSMEQGLASYYVRHYFSDESKHGAMILVKYIHKEFLKILKDTDWMDETTRRKAQEKANTIKAYIGYPKELLNDTFMNDKYADLPIVTDSYLESSLAFKKWKSDNNFYYRRKFIEESSEEAYSSKYSNLIKANAYYNPLENSIAIPAGILHGTFYNKDRPKYMNFGVIGYVIGHEITHGFDNQGRNYDKVGKEVNWWGKKSDEQFRKKVKCIIDQYDNYTTDIGLKVNGEKTQNENIADNGGLKEAYMAYQSWTRKHGTEPLLPGVRYTQNQIFWLSAAHVWCSKYQPEVLKEHVLFDEHSPGKFRIIGPMSNMAEFSKDFNCSPDAPMNRKYKCKVW